MKLFKDQDDHGDDDFDFDRGDDDGHHHGHHGHHLPPVQLNATLDLNATDGSGHTLNGSGNPASGWEIENFGRIQLASDVHYRTGDTVQPSAVEENGDLVYNMPAGPQVVDLAHGVSSANAARGATSFDFSFSTGHDPAHLETIQQFLASGGKFEIQYDLDPGHGDKFLTLDAAYDPVHNTGGSHVVWETADSTFFTKGTIIIADDGGNQYVTQNSQNLAFYRSLIDVDPHTPGIQVGPVSPAGTYDINYAVYDPHNQVVAAIHNDLVLS
jgi:hypothetical protein